jgi:hypothetical protein
MGNFLRIANEDESRRYFYNDTEEFIDLRAEMSKKSASALLKFAPRKEDDLDGGLRFIAKAFKDLILGWSLTDDEGKAIAPSIEVYDKLDAASAQWIDRTVGNHLRVVLGTEAEEAEKKDESLESQPLQAITE